MNDLSVSRDPVEELAEEFLERKRRGELPTLEEYVDRHPDLAEDIRDLFPALVKMEKLKPAADSSQSISPKPAIVVEESLRQLGDFRIIRQVGRGGMGVVYEAEQVSLGRHVALKVLPRHLLADPKVKQRFEREARAAARLHHTNIVPVFGVGEHEGTHYYAMQFIQGLALDDVLAELKRMRHDSPGSGVPSGEMRISKRTDVSARDVARSLMTGRFVPPADDPAATPPVPVAAMEAAGETPAASNGQTIASRGSETVRLSSSSALLPGSSEATAGTRRRQHTYWHSVAQIGVQVAQSLAYAHEQGVLHRDIKPSNLMLDLRGTVWITDFGLAKDDDARNLTEQGDILGTLRYMPPEAFEGKCDARGDVYSLGLTLYELLTLQPAFLESDRHKLIKQVTTAEPPRIDTLRPDVPRDLATIIHKAIDREPGRRYDSSASFAADLQRYIDDEPILARRISLRERCRRWCRRNPGVASLAAALVLVFLTGFGGVAWKWREAEVQFARAEKAHGAAVKARGEAEKAQLLAEDRAEDFQRGLYFQSIARADLEYASNNVGRADQILDACPAKYRHWEWHYLKRLCQSELLALKGHTDLIRSVAFSPDGRLLASAGHDLTVRLWELPSGREVRVLHGHESQINSIVFSPDGRLLATVSGLWTDRKAGELKLWDAVTGQELFTTHPHRTAISQVVFTPDGQRLVTAGWDSSVQFHDVITGEVVKVLKTETKASTFKCLAIRPDGKRIAVGCHQPVILVWDAETDEEVGQLSGPDGHQSDVNCLAFSPDGQQLVSGSWDRRVKLWNVSTRKVEGSFEEHTDTVTRVAFSPSGQEIASASMDGTVRVWNKQKGTAARVIRGHSREIHAVTFSPGGAYLASAGYDRTVKIWGATSTQVNQRLPTGSGPVPWMDGFAFSPDGRLVAAVSCTQPSGFSNHVYVWESSSRKLLHRFGERRGATMYRVAFSPDSQLLATDWDNAVKVWDPGTGAEIATFEGHTARVTGVAFSSDPSHLASASEDGTVLLWDLTKKERSPAGVLRGHEGPVRCLTFLPDGRLVTGGADRTARVWDVASRKTLLTFREHSGAVTSLACSSDGRRVASAGADETARIWSPDTGRILVEIRGHVGTVNSVAFSSDGLRLATAGEDGQIAVWHAATGEEALTLRRQAQSMRMVAFSPGDRSVGASSLGSFAVMFWDGAEATRVSKSRRLLAWHKSEAQGCIALRRWQPAIHHLSVLLEASPSNRADWPAARMCNNAAWRNVTGPERDRLPAQMLPFARKAVELEPDSSMYHNTLGVVHYRSGQHREAIAALEKSLELGKGAYDAFDLYFLAMCHQQLGEHEKAREYYDKAESWMQANQARLAASHKGELEAFRAEAEDLLKPQEP